MCLICDRIQMIKDEANPFFVKELETGYVVWGTRSVSKAIRFFCAKSMKRNFLIWMKILRKNI